MTNLGGNQFESGCAKSNFSVSLVWFDKCRSFLLFLQHWLQRHRRGRQSPANQTPFTAFYPAQLSYLSESLRRTGPQWPLIVNIINKMWMSTFISSDFRANASGRIFPCWRALSRKVLESASKLGQVLMDGMNVAQSWTRGETLLDMLGTSTVLHCFAQLEHKSGSLLPSFLICDIFFFKLALRDECKHRFF